VGDRLHEIPFAVLYDYRPSVVLTIRQRCSEAMSKFISDRQTLGANEDPPFQTSACYFLTLLSRYQIP
jgi:hypothetical protein